jgi:glycosyltransferase involved in cell wall biosynthesis
MNIAFVVVKHIARGGGIEKYTEELGARLAARGHAVRVYAMRHYGTVEPTHRGMEILAVPCLPLPQAEKLTASVFGVVHASLTGWADVVHLHHVGPGALGWLPRLVRKPSVLQFHGLEWKRSRWGRVGATVLKALEWWSVRTNRRFTAVSQVQCEYFADAYGITVRYIPSGTDVRTPPPAREIRRLGLEPGRYLLFASRLVREKGAHYLIEAFRRLNSPHKLVVAGDVPGAAAYRQELEALAGGDTRILFPGFVEGRLLEELFGHALLYVQPSEVEGLSIALLEAMSYGLPCVTSDIPENREATNDLGMTFRSGDVDDLACVLRTALAVASRSDGAEARALMQTRYSWDHIADEFEAYYAEVLGLRPSATRDTTASMR